MGSADGRARRGTAIGGGACGGAAANRRDTRRGNTESSQGPSAFLAWQARPAQRTPGIYSRRDAAPAAHLSRCALVSAAPLEGRNPVPGSAERRVSLAWTALAAVEDPEIPAVNIVDLGLIRSVEIRADGILDVGLSPTYVGCPATEVIRRSVEDALSRAGAGDFVVTTVLSPAWTRDWI